MPFNDCDDKIFENLSDNTWLLTVVYWLPPDDIVYTICRFSTFKGSPSGSDIPLVKFMTISGSSWVIIIGTGLPTGPELSTNVNVDVNVLLFPTRSSTLPGNKLNVTSFAVIDGYVYFTVKSWELTIVKSETDPVETVISFKSKFVIGSEDVNVKVVCWPGASRDKVLVIVIDGALVSTVNVDEYVDEVFCAASLATTV